MSIYHDKDYLDEMLLESVAYTVAKKNVLNDFCHNVFQLYSLKELCQDLGDFPRRDLHVLCLACTLSPLNISLRGSF